jgi:hypothetical protein
VIDPQREWVGKAVYPTSPRFAETPLELMHTGDFLRDSLCADQINSLQKKYLPLGGVVRDPIERFGHVSSLELPQDEKALVVLSGRVPSKSLHCRKQTVGHGSGQINRQISDDVH